LSATDDDGNELEEPGFVYEKEYIKAQTDDADFGFANYIWNPKKVINIFVCDFSSELDTLDGFITEMPSFDHAELMPLGQVYSPKQLLSCVVCLRNSSVRYISYLSLLAHELGHFLGLAHVFENTDENNDYCDDTPFYDREAYMENVNLYDIYRLLSGTEDTYFISTNIMDYYYSFFCAITPDQKKRMNHTLQYAYSVPRPYGKEPDLSWEEIKK